MLVSTSPFTWHNAQLHNTVQSACYLPVQCKLGFINTSPKCQAQWKVSIYPLKSAMMIRSQVKTLGKTMRFPEMDSHSLSTNSLFLQTNYCISCPSCWTQTGEKAGCGEPGLPCTAVHYYRKESCLLAGAEANCTPPNTDQSHISTVFQTPIRVNQIITQFKETYSKHIKKKLKAKIDYNVI